MSAPTALVPLIDGFEEIEAITIIDVLRRGGVAVTTAAAGKAMQDDPLMRTGSHDIAVRADADFEILRNDTFDAVVLPGGPGTFALNEVDGLHALLRRHAQDGKTVAAVCAAPTILADAGLLHGVDATCHPTTESRMKGATLQARAVVQSGRLITSRGPGTTMAFALALVATLVDQDQANTLAEAMQVGLT